MTSELIHCMASVYDSSFYVHSYLHIIFHQRLIDYKNKRYAKQKQPVAVKKDAAKQSGIKNIMCHLRWLIRTRPDISLRPSGLVRPRTTDIKLLPSALVRTRTDIKLRPIGLVRSYKD